MKAVGIIAEYNPLHNGHIYHIDQARKIAGSEAVVIALSGDFVQRGEPAILDKWTRTRHALQCGADLVIEIPVYYCLGNAGQYGYAGTSLLRSTGKVSHIAFGSESGKADALLRTAVFLKTHNEEIEEGVRSLRSTGLSYPAARSRVYADLRARCGENISGEEIRAELDILNSSNDILALEYIIHSGDMTPVPVKRIGADYNDRSASDAEGHPYLSASGIREYFRTVRGGTLNESYPVRKYIPGCTASDLECGITTFPDDWLTVLRYALMTSSAEELEDCPSGGEGLGNLLKSAAAEASSFDELVMKVKSRRYTYSRISRLCMQAVLGIRRTDFTYVSPDYIRVLGMNETGRKLLSEIRTEESASVPVITNINKERLADESRGKKLLELDVHAADIYNLVTGRNVYEASDHRMMPVIL